MNSRKVGRSNQSFPLLPVPKPALKTKEPVLPTILRRSPTTRAKGR